VEALKKALLGILALPGVTAPFRSLTHDRAAIFMLHRFRIHELAVDGHDPETLRRVMSFLRRERYNLLSLEELFSRLEGNGPRLYRAVAFTIDDGYFDQAVVGAPIFAEFDCPVTTFLTTGFLDGMLWQWWDRIEYVFRQTDIQPLSLELAGEELTYTWRDASERGLEQMDFTERCKRVSEVEKEGAIVRLARQAEVDLPEKAPAQYSPMSWDQVRCCEKRGMTFGAHTVTHPILSQASDTRSRQEIADSWERIRSELCNPLPVFCYPNGSKNDYGSREIETLRSLHFVGALSSVPGYAGATPLMKEAYPSYSVSRFPYPDNVSRLASYVSGVERFRRMLSGHPA
jgi:peptidoglycan/xylan/chitin deacetylase (PgdA/CDA1 family)